MTTLHEKYPLIVLHCRRLGSKDWYIKEQLALAERLDAPRDCYAIEGSNNSMWLATPEYVRSLEDFNKRTGHLPKEWIEGATQ